MSDDGVKYETVRPPVNAIRSKNRHNIIDKGNQNEGMIFNPLNAWWQGWKVPKEVPLKDISNINYRANDV